MYNQRSAYWDELQFVEDSMNLRNIGRYMNVNLRKQYGKQKLDIAKSLGGYWLL